MLEKVGVDIISETSWKSFFIGFERYKSKIEAYLLSPSADLPRVDPSDDGLRAEVDNHIQMFMNNLNLLPPRFHVSRAIQMDPEV